MRSTTRSIGVIVLLGLLAGCGPGESDKPASAADLQARLSTALVISDPAARNSALAKVAEDSASAGEAEIATKAINEISDPSFQGKTAASAASKLAGVGKRSEATKIATNISDPSLRNEVLSKLAKDK